MQDHLRPLIGQLLLLTTDYTSIPSPVLDKLACLLSSRLQYLALATRNCTHVACRTLGNLADVAWVLFADPDGLQPADLHAYHAYILDAQRRKDSPLLTFKVSIQKSLPSTAQVEINGSAVKPSYWEPHLPDFPSAHTYMNSVVRFLLSVNQKR